MFDHHQQSAESIKAFWNCRDECHAALSNRVLEMGEGNVNARTVTTLTDCAAICQLMAEFMTRQSPMSHELADACAVICRDCAVQCEELNGAAMMRCAEICSRCAVLAGKVT